MARIPLAKKYFAPGQPKGPENSQRPKVLPFPSVYTQRRDDVCAALRGLADAWGKLPVRDEAAWTAFAADAGLALARYLLQHAATVRGAMLEREHRADGGDISPPAEPASASSGARHAVPSDCTEAEADRAADAAVLALVGLACALGSDNAEAALLHVAVGTRAVSVARGTPDLTRPRHGARQFS